jgi:hypothetical protein
MDLLNILTVVIYSKVTECFKKEVSYDSIVMTFTVCIKTSSLTKTQHYTGYQQKLFDEIKRLKEVEGYGYKRISYILYEKGYRSIRTDSILRHNYIYSIYKKGKIREKRINRELHFFLYTHKYDCINTVGNHYNLIPKVWW